MHTESDQQIELFTAKQASKQAESEYYSKQAAPKPYRLSYNIYTHNNMSTGAGYYNQFELSQQRSASSLNQTGRYSTLPRQNSGQNQLQGMNM